jgi:hypothetical protein
MRIAWIAPLLLASTLHAQTPAPTPTPYIIGPAGAYSVQTIGSTKVEYGEGWVRISWVFDPGPAPAPAPDPTPPPLPPAPLATGRLFVTMVYDGATETQAQAKTRADLATSPAWIGLNASFRAFDVKQKVLDTTGIRAKLAALPCVLMQDAQPGATTAPIIKTMPSVDSSDSVLSVVKSLRGAK